MCFSSKKNDDNRTEHIYMREIGKGIEVPLRLVKGFSVSEMDERIFEVTVTKGEIVIENFNSRFHFESNQNGEYKRIFGKYVLDRDTQIKVTERATGEEYLVNYALKG